jgi:hypothetical protein
VLWVEVIGDDDYRVYLGRLPFPILVRSKDVTPRIDLLEQLRPAILEHAPILAEVDLRFESRVIVRPAIEEIEALTAAAASAPTGDGPAKRAESSHGAQGGTDAIDAPASGEAPVQSTRSSVWDPQPKET